MTGGYEGCKNVSLSSVEAYDCYKNKWDYLPCMIHKRHLHGAVCMGNKLFIIGGRNTATCEVFDSSSMKFTSIKQLERSSFESVSAVNLGDEIITICSGGKEENNKTFTYSVGKNEWYSNNKDFDEFDGFLCLSKLPLI